MFLLKSFKGPYVLNQRYDSFDFCAVVKSSSKVLLSTFLISLSDFNVKVMDLQNRGNCDWYLD